MPEVTEVVIHHNPACGTSRNVLAIIEAAGYRPFGATFSRKGRRQRVRLLASLNRNPMVFYWSWLGGAPGLEFLKFQSRVEMDS